LLIKEIGGEEMFYHPNLTYQIRVENPKNFFFEMGPIRPPSESQSLLIRATRNCPWNRCEFCPTYKNVKFEYRKVEEIKKDIDVAKVIADGIKTASWRFGLAGRVSNEVIKAIFQGNPEIYQGDGNSQLKLQNLINVANWLSSGGKTCFLQDANTLIMRTPELIEVIKYLKTVFPSIERVTSYARSKTCAKKTLQELKDLKGAGLSRLHVGLESGCDEVLEFMQKGVTAKEHISGGRKVVESGISLSEYIMPGLGGKNWSEKHARESARVLNEINPDFIRLRSLIVKKGSPLRDKRDLGQFEELSEDEVVDEIGFCIENLNCSSYLASDQMSNLLSEVEGQLPQDKEKILEVIRKYKNKSPMERLEFRLKTRLRSYRGVYGRIEPELNQKIQEALEAIRKESPDAETKTNQAISALKEGFV